MSGLCHDERTGPTRCVGGTGRFASMGRYRHAGIGIRGASWRARDCARCRGGSRSWLGFVGGVGGAGRPVVAFGCGIVGLRTPDSCLALPNRRDPPVPRCRAGHRPPGRPTVRSGTGLLDPARGRCSRRHAFACGASGAEGLTRLGAAIVVADAPRGTRCRGGAVGVGDADSDRCAGDGRVRCGTGGVGGTRRSRYAVRKSGSGPGDGRCARAAACDCPRSSLIGTGPAGGKWRRNATAVAGVVGGACRRAPRVGSPTRGPASGCRGVDGPLGGSGRHHDDDSRRRRRQQSAGDLERGPQHAQHLHGGGDRHGYRQRSQRRQVVLQDNDIAEGHRDHHPTRPVQ